MIDRRLIARSATDDEIAVEVLASVLGITVEEAARIAVEEADKAIGVSIPQLPRYPGELKVQYRTNGSCESTLSGSLCFRPSSD